MLEEESEEDSVSSNRNTSRSVPSIWVDINTDVLKGFWQRPQNDMENPLFGASKSIPQDGLEIKLNVPI